VKSLILIIPIFACTIVFNTVLAQLQTFSVQQGTLMDNRLFSGSFKVPPASLQSIPYIVLILLVPLYELLFVPFARGFTGISSGITPLQRMGVGLFTVTFSMVTAAMVIGIYMFIEARNNSLFLLNKNNNLLHNKWIIMLTC
jgi:dipeptide/tripeptide permease